MISRAIGLIVIFFVYATVSLAQEASLWTYNGNDVGEQKFQIRQIALTLDATRVVTFAQQFGTNSPQKPKFAVWDFVTGKRVSTWQGETMSVGLAISNDGAKVASLGLPTADDAPIAISVWDVAMGKRLVRANVQMRGDARRTSLRFSKDGKGVFLLGGTVQVVEVSSGKVVPVGRKRSFPAEDIDWSETGGRLVWLDPARMYVYSPAEDLARDRQPKRTIDMPYQATDSRLSVDGKAAFVSLMPNDGPRAGYQFLGIWDVVSGKNLQTYDCKWRESEFLRNLFVSPDGQFAAGNRGRGDLLWIYSLKKNVAPDFPRERMAPVGFTPGGVLIVRVSGRPLRYLDPETFKVIQPPLADNLRRGGKPDATTSEQNAEPDPPQPTLRTWTSSNGKFSVQALLIRSENGVVHLKKKDGKVIQVPVEKLSAPDREFLSKQE